jgi:hypothetical protein
MDDFNGEFTITADENGVFAIHGMLNAADPEYELEATDSATILLHAKDAAGICPDSFLPRSSGETKPRSLPEAERVPAMVLRRTARATFRPRH